ncbi:hypothetical protein LCGC14_2677950, partial [marine sediment metagenome]
SYHRAGGIIDDSLWILAEAMVESALRHWQKADNGIWEVRSEPKHFTFSKLMAWVAVTVGVPALLALGKLVALNYAGCLLIIIVMYAGIVKFLAKLPVIPFFRGIVDAQAVAYSTASSNATLPVPPPLPTSPPPPSPATCRRRRSPTCVSPKRSTRMSRRPPDMPAR